MAGVLIVKSFKDVFRTFRKKVSTEHFSNLADAVTNNSSPIPKYLQYSDKFEDLKEKAEFENDMRIFQDFVTPEEEESLFNEVEPILRRLRYESYHWDDAIKGYRELEKEKWNENNLKIINKIKDLAFKQGTEPLKQIHVLDLKASGVIKPHVDSVKFCGDTIAGLSMLSDSLMRLKATQVNDKFVDVLLKRRSLYVMTGVARYDYTHEILHGNAIFYDVPVIKSRRISIICRNHPVHE